MVMARTDTPLPIPPVPPPPPARGMAVYQDAPMPNPDFPRRAGTGPAIPSLAPGVIAAPQTYRGETFTPGRSSTDHDTRLFDPAPGVTLRIPLEDGP